MKLTEREVRPGQCWRDRDKRMHGGNRVLRVVFLDDAGDGNGYACCRTKNATGADQLRETRIRLRSLVHRFELVEDVAPEGAKGER